MKNYQVVFYTEFGDYVFIEDLKFDDLEKAKEESFRRATLTGMDQGDTDTYRVIAINENNEIIKNEKGSLLFFDGL